LALKLIEIYTDGSCHTQLKIGAWAAIVLINNTPKTLEGIVKNTSHNRMELLGVIKALEYIKMQKIEFSKINIYSDSQYVVNIPDRKEKLILKNYLTNKETPIQNSDLIQDLINWLETSPIEFIKVQAHQKKSNIINYNREADKIARRLVRNAVKIYMV
jgi:ribonuclease HI